MPKINPQHVRKVWIYGTLHLFLTEGKAYDKKRRYKTLCGLKVHPFADEQGGWIEEVWTPAPTEHVDNACETCRANLKALRS